MKILQVRISIPLRCYLWTVIFLLEIGIPEDISLSTHMNTNMVDLPTRVSVAASCWSFLLRVLIFLLVIIKAARATYEDCTVRVGPIFHNTQFVMCLCSLRCILYL